MTNSIWIERKPCAVGRQLRFLAALLLLAASACTSRSVPIVHDGGGDSDVPEGGSADAGDAGADSDVGDGGTDMGPADLGWGPDAPVCDALTGECVVRPRLPRWPGLSTEFGYMDSVGSPCFQDRGSIGPTAQVALRGDDIYVLSATYHPWAEGLESQAPGYTLLRNSGTGWETLAALWDPGGGSTSHDLSVMPDGTVYGSWGLGGCGLVRFYPGPMVCRVPAWSTLDGLALPRRLFMANDRLFLLGDTSISELTETGAVDLFSFPATTGIPWGFWTDGTDAIVTGTEALLLRSSGGTLTQVPNTPADSYWGVAVQSIDDFIVTSDIAVQRYVNGALEVEQMPPTLCEYPEGIVSTSIANGLIYYVTYTQFGRLTSSGFEPIFNIPCGSNYYFSDVAARESDGRVFLAVQGQYQLGNTCGGTHLLHYDGTTLQEF